MKNILVTLVLCFSSFSMAFSQTFSLTNENFKSIDNPDQDYTIINVDGKTKNEVYLLAKSFINTYYNNPKYVSNDIENEQIVIDAVGSESMRVIYRLSGPNIWRLEYKIELLFKDNKILFRPIFKRLDNTDDTSTVALISGGFGSHGVFDKKGKPNKKSGNEKIDSEINKIFNDFSSGIKKSITSSDW